MVKVPSIAAEITLTRKTAKVLHAGLAFEEVEGSDKFFDMDPALGGEIVLQEPEVMAAGQAYRAIDGVCPSIISGQHEQPVAKFAVQVPEIEGGGFGALAELRAFVVSAGNL